MQEEKPKEFVNATVMIVEDDLFQQKLLTASLEMIGCRVITANDGVDALRRLDEATPDLMICDLMMPEISGLELLKALRANPETEAIPFMIVSAMGGEEDIIRGFSLGADDYIIKPVSLKELQARVKARIRRPPVPAHQVRRDTLTGVLSQSVFMTELEREITRAHVRGEKGHLVCIGLHEQEALAERLGKRLDAPITKQLIALVAFDNLPTEIMARDQDNHILVFVPQMSEGRLREMLAQLARRIVAHTFVAGDELFRLTPLIGLAATETGLKAEALYDRAIAACTHAGLQLDLQPSEYVPSMQALAQEIKVRTQAIRKVSLRSRLMKNWREAYQIAMTILVGVVVPFLIYAFLGSNNLDISQAVYIIVVIALLATAVLIWWETWLATRRVDPPEVKTTHR